MYRWQFLVLVLFCLTASADQHGDGPPNPCHVHYPNIPGELVLENDKLVVQRFVIEPGEWEGIHPHPPDQLWIHLKGGEWTVKYGDEANTSVAEDGAIGWWGEGTPLSAQHESGNTGDEPIELVWVTLKPGCMEPPQ